MSRRAFILGGSGQIGRAIALNLVEAGWSVVSGQRSAASLPPALRDHGVQPLALDRDDTDALGAALDGEFDAVVDTVAFNPAHARQWISLQGRVGALTVISTGSVYAGEHGRTLDEARETGPPVYPVPRR